MRRRDTQQQHVYKWEDKLRQHPCIDPEPLPRIIIRAAVKALSDEYGLTEPPTLRFQARLKRRAYYQSFDQVGHGPKGSETRSGTGAIVLPGNVNSWATNMLVIMHEMAHAIHFQEDKKSEQETHGPEFVGIFIHIMVNHTDFTLEDLEGTADLYGIRYNRRA